MPIAGRGTASRATHRRRVPARRVLPWVALGVEWLSSDFGLGSVGGAARSSGPGALISRFWWCCGRARHWVGLVTAATSGEPAGPGRLPTPASLSRRCLLHRHVADQSGHLSARTCRPCCRKRHAHPRRRQRLPRCRPPTRTARASGRARRQRRPLPLASAAPAAAARPRGIACRFRTRPRSRQSSVRRQASCFDCGPRR